MEVPQTDLLRPDLSASGRTLIDAEFGRMDVPEERAFMEETSPFENLHKGPNFPDPLILTSTTDPNVFPALPRRFAARAASLGLPYLFYESSEGGHAMAVTPEQHAAIDAMAYVYLAQRLMDKPVMQELKSR